MAQQMYANIVDMTKIALVLIRLNCPHVLLVKWQEVMLGLFRASNTSQCIPCKMWFKCTTYFTNFIGQKQREIMKVNDNYIQLNK